MAAWAIWDKSFATLSKFVFETPFWILKMSLPPTNNITMSYPHTASSNQQLTQVFITRCAAVDYKVYFHMTCGCRHSFSIWKSAKLLSVFTFKVRELTDYEKQIISWMTPKPTIVISVVLKRQKSASSKISLLGINIVLFVCNLTPHKMVMASS